MKIFSLHNEDCPYVLDIQKWRRAREYLFAAQKILGCGLRDMAVICGYVGEAEFRVFIRRFTVGHRLLSKSPKFSNMKTAIDNELRRKYKNEVVEENMGLVGRKKDRNRNSGTDCF